MSIAIMNDAFDAYLSRKLKNWTASRRLPANGRERLLSRAAVGPLPPEQGGRWFGIKDLSSTPNYRKDFNWLTVPFSQSRLSLVHLAISGRVAI